MAGIDLTTSSPIPSKPTVSRAIDHPAAFPPNTSPLEAAGHSKPVVQELKFPVKDGHDGSAHGFLHLPADAASKPFPKTAAILLSGAGGGVTGPSGLYLSLGTKLPALSAHIPTLRLDYRYPARTAPCVADTKAAMTHLQENFGCERFVLVGWSFGGAPVFSLAGRDDRVVGAATVASQTADAITGAREAGRRSVPILLCHGTGDRTLAPRCSEHLHDAWLQGYRGKGENDTAKLIMFEGDDHALTRNAKEVEAMMVDFIVGCAGAKIRDAEGVILTGDVLGGKEERVDIMMKGGDLRGPERVE